MISYTDRKNQISAFGYDGLNRKTATTFADGSRITLNFDPAGRVNQINDTQTGSILFGYDLVNRVISEETTQGMVSYQYDAIGRRTTMTVNGQTPISYGYDTDSRLTTIMALTQAFSLTYDANGRRTALAYPNGVTTTYSYDNNSRILGINHSTTTKTIENITYGYDQNGLRTAMNRLNSATALPQAVTAAYDAANELTTYNNPTPNLTYDANGNLTSDGIKTYTWNSRNQLIAISGGGINASFVYDAVGRRISKTINGVRTDFQYDGNDIIAEIGGGSAVNATYIRTHNIDEPLARITSASIEYYHADALGSVFALTDAYGNTTVSYSYDPFGNTTQTGVSTNPFQYTGREQDGTGLLFYRARYFSSTLQRFISEDPFELEGGDANFYSYAYNNPVNFRDPLGLWGFGPTVSGSVEGGAGVVGAGATASIGGGVFGGGDRGINFGAFASFGAFAGGPGYGPNYPPGNQQNFSAGGYAGGGLGAFFTNAKCAKELSGPFDTYSYNIGFKGLPWLNFSVQFGYSNGTWILSVVPPSPFSRGSGKSISSFPTNTWTTP